MKKLVLFSALMGLSLAAYAQNVQLQQPQYDNAKTLMEVLQQRHTERTFADRAITDRDLATLLWAACGINRPESGKLTVPSAINAQDVQVYVVRKDGAYLYVPKEHLLQQVSKDDLRAAVAGRQAFAAKAPLSLVLVSNHAKFGNMPAEAAGRMGVVDCGYVSQNICLTCAALGLNTVPRATMDTQALKKALNLGDECDLVMNHQVGYPEK